MKGIWISFLRTYFIIEAVFLSTSSGTYWSVVCVVCNCVVCDSVFVCLHTSSYLLCLGGVILPNHNPIIILLNSGYLIREFLCVFAQLLM